jgi:aldehyde:ferredoxin oxidoreductase
LVEAIEPKVARNYIGGRGLGIYYLLKEVDPSCDPLGPANKIIMSTGPLTGTKAPTGERLVRFAAIMNDRNRAAGRSGVGAT